MIFIQLLVLLSFQDALSSSPDGESRVRLINIIPLGDAYASSTVNVSIFRRSVVLTTPKGQFVAFYDAKGDATILLINKKGRVAGRYTVFPKLSSRLIQDGHCVISIGYSPDGILHVIYGAHGTKPFYAQIALDEIVPSFDNVVNATTWSETMTYPQFYTIKDQLWLLYRHVPDIFVSQYVLERKSFVPLYETPLLSYDGLPHYTGASVYINQMASFGDNIAMFWAYRLPPRIMPEDERRYLVVNDGLWSAQSNDGGKSWFDIHGRTLTLPISYEQIINTGKTINILQSGGLLNQGSSTMGSNGNIYDVHQAKDFEGCPQIFLTILDNNGTVVLNEAVSTNKEHFELLGKGTLLLPLSRADVAVSDRMVHVIYRQNGRLVIASKLLNNLHGDWRYFIPETPDLGGWEPNYDFVAWKNNHSLDIYVQSARQGRMDFGIKGKASPAKLYKFIERD